jgi:RNA polymerase sigma-70 factor (ECF subfamily)
MTFIDCRTDALASSAATVRDLVSRYQMALLRQVTQLTKGDRAWAEDVVQETFIRAWRNADTLTSSYGSVRCWLFRVAHNLVIDGYRSASCRPTVADPEAVPPLVEPSDYVEQVLSKITVQQILENLPPAQRSVMTLVFGRGLTIVEAARVLGVPVGTAKSRVFYALRRLRADRDKLVG